MGYLYPALEGPPSPEDMESLARDLIYDGKIAEAHRVTSVMTDHYLCAGSTADAWERTQGFRFWLGMRAATGMLNAKREVMLDRRRLRRAR